MSNTDGQVISRMRHKIFFDSPDVDFNFQWLMACQKYGGASFGELFNTARRIDQASDTSWADEFEKEAQRVEVIAETSSAGGHRVSAHEAYLRAHCYYRGAYMGAPRSVDPDKNARLFKKLVACFEKAMKLAAFPVERVHIPWKSYAFPGYFFKAASGNEPRPTLLIMNGGEMHAEDHYFWLARAAIERGYHALTWDAPMDAGTRHCVPDATFASIGGVDGLKSAYRSAVDFMVARADVDSDRLVVTGESYGGQKSLFIGCNDDRFAAVIPNSPIYDVSEVLRTSFPPQLLQAASPEESNAMVARGPATMRATVEGVLWSHGFQSLNDWIPMAEELKSDPSRIACAFMAICAESEPAELQRQAKYAYDNVSSTVKTLRMTTAAEGADMHCQVNNLPLLQQVLFDWLDDVL